MIRALMAVGVDAVREQVLERGYPQLAELSDQAHDTEETAARRSRYAARVDRAISE